MAIRDISHISTHVASDSAGWPLPTNQDGAPLAWDRTDKKIEGKL